MSEGTETRDDPIVHSAAFASSPPNSAASFDPSASPECPSPVTPEQRYRERTLLGSGQMGRVEETYDVLLRRRVALKILRADAGPHAAARFEREATITANLEHPGIVTVHDSGRFADGGSYYTMQLVRGKSLAAALRERSVPLTLARRHAFVEGLLHVCEAVGFAHSRGVVHRDLKPANIMLGEHGETVVVDWGLARYERHVVTSSEGSSEGGTAGADPSLTETGALVGTPLYMSPEQATAAPVAPTSDVWSLGIVLFELLSGRPPLHGSDAPTVMARIRAAELPRLSAVELGVSLELVAITERALAARPGDRYPNAAEFATDLRRWLAGHRVAAYAYRPRELLLRFVRTWRVPLIAGGSAVLVVVAVLAFAYVQARADRDRARKAEAVAYHKREEAVELSTRLLAEQARFVQRRGGSLDAELLASAALEQGESAIARGVLAFSGLALHPQNLRESPAPCKAGQLSGQGRFVLCRDIDVLTLYSADGSNLLWSARFDDPIAHAQMHDESRVLVTTLGGQLHVLSAAGATLSTTRAGVLVPLSDAKGTAWLALGDSSIASVDARDSFHPQRDPCPEHMAASAWVAGRSVVVCRFSADIFIGGSERPLATRLELRRVTVMTAVSDSHALLGLHDGALVQLDVKTGLLSPAYATGARNIAMLHPLGAGLVAVSTEDSGVIVWDTHTQGVVVRLPARWGDSLRRRADGVFVSLSAERVRTWVLPRTRSATRFKHTQGLASAVLSHNGSLLATTSGGGELTVWDTASGALLTRQSWSAGVLKDAVFSPDDRVLVALSAKDPSPRVFDTQTWKLRHILRTSQGGGGRRIMALSDGSVWKLGYENGIRRWSSAYDPSEPRLFELPWAIDGSSAPSGDFGVALTQRGGVWRISAGAVQPTRLGAVPGASAADIDDSGEVLVLVLRDKILVLDPSLTVLSQWAHADPVVLDVSVSGDATLVATAGRDGTARVWDRKTGEMIAHLSGHEQRVATVELHRAALVTGSWDGVAHRWALAPITAPRAVVAAQGRVWGVLGDLR